MYVFACVKIHVDMHTYFKPLLLIFCNARLPLLFFFCLTAFLLLLFIIDLFFFFRCCSCTVFSFSFHGFRLFFFLSDIHTRHPLSCGCLCCLSCHYLWKARAGCVSSKVFSQTVHLFSHASLSLSFKFDGPSHLQLRDSSFDPVASLDIYKQKYIYIYSVYIRMCLYIAHFVAPRFSSGVVFGISTSCCNTE